jgi:hypothetical protein
MYLLTTSSRHSPVLDGVSSDRGAQAALLAIEIFGCPQSAGDTLSRDDLLSLEKAIAEGTPSEWLIVLGWLLNTRRLLISLPPDKRIAWKADIDIFPEKGRRVRAKELESLIGRLQHIAGVVSPASHFLIRLRAALHRAETHNGARLGSEERKDLQLWREILDYATKGVDMNSLTVREPDVFSSSPPGCKLGHQLATMVPLFTPSGIGQIPLPPVLPTSRPTSPSRSFCPSSQVQHVQRVN